MNPAQTHKDGTMTMHREKHLFIHTQLKLQAPSYLSCNCPTRDLESEKKKSVMEAERCPTMQVCFMWPFCAANRHTLLDSTRSFKQVWLDADSHLTASQYSAFSRLSRCMSGLGKELGIKQLLLIAAIDQRTSSEALGISLVISTMFISWEEGLSRVHSSFSS